jgi:hypothetical protein
VTIADASGVGGSRVAMLLTGAQVRRYGAEQLAVVLDTDFSDDCRDCQHGWHFWYYGEPTAAASVVLRFLRTVCQATDDSQVAIAVGRDDAQPDG